MDQFLGLKKPQKEQEVFFDENDQNKPWVEKYRPKNLNQVIYQDEIVESFKGIKNTGKMPHLLLHGPPGIGKTSIILALVRELFGKDYKNRILELNASDDRGIDKVREKIKKFAEIQVSNIGRYKFKIIILDEADNMTQAAQAALRRIIEDYSKVTRFCLICNYITKIIEPLGSRCIKMRFKDIPQELQYERLDKIAVQEQVKIDKNALQQLIEMCRGDMRKSLNMLQLSKMTYQDKIISSQDIILISDILPTQNFYQDFILPYKKLSNEKDRLNFIKSITQQGFTCQQILDAAYNWNINQNQDNQNQSKIMIVIGDLYFNLKQGGRDDLNMMLFFEKIDFLVKQFDQ